MTMPTRPQRPSGEARRVDPLALLFRLLPRRFRDTYGEEMREIWAREREAAAGGFSSIRYWGRAIVDTLGAALREHSSDLRADLRDARRRLTRRPLFSIVAILSLSLGMGLTVAVFTLFKTAFLDPIPGVPAQSEVVNIKTIVGELETFDLAPWSVFESIRDAETPVSPVAGFHGTMASLRLSDDAEPEVVPLQLTTAGYWRVLSLQPTLGRFFEPDEDRGAARVAVVSRRFWETRLGNAPLGTELLVNGHRFELVGVAPDGFRGHFKAFHFDVFLPTGSADAAGVPTPWDRESGWVEMIGHLDESTRVEVAASSLAGVASFLSTRATDDWSTLRLQVERLTGIDADLRGGAFALLTTLLLVSAAGLIVAGLNVSAMMLGDMAWRQREMALRRALGAPPGRLARQLFVESGTIALLAAVLGGGLAVGAVGIAARALTDVDPRLALELQVDPTLILAAAVFVTLTALIAGGAPSRLAMRTDPATTLRVSSGDGPATSRFLSTVVVVQIVLSFVVLGSATTLARSVARTDGVDPGFTHEGVLAMGLDPDLAALDRDAGIALLRDALAAVKDLPGIESTALTNRVPLSLGASLFPRPTEISIAGHQPPPGSSGFLVEHAVVSSGYFETLRIPLVTGRDFADEDREDSRPVAIVNQSFADRWFEGSDPVGRRFRRDDADVEIVGVVRDSRYRSLDEPSTPFVYLSWHQQRPRSGVLLLRAPSGVGGTVRNGLRRLAPDLPLADLQPLSERVSAALGPQRAAAAAMSALGVVGLLLSAAGLSGVMASWVGRRRHEFGVRMTLGATPGSLRGLVMRRALRVAGLGVLLGAPAALLASLSRDPTLRGLAGLVGEALDNPAETDPEAFTRALDAMTRSANSLSDGSETALSWRALMSGEEEPAGPHREVLLIRPPLDFGTLAPAAGAMAGVEAAFAALEPAIADGLRLRLTGSAPMMQDELHSLEEGMGLVGLVALILVTGLLRLGLGSWRLTLALVVTLAVGLAWTAAFATLAIGSLNLISVAFAVLFIGLSVDFGIHVLLRWREEAGVMEPATGTDAAVVPLRRMGGRTGGVLILCAISTAFGFYAFLPTSYRGLSELGLISGSAMFIALFANLTVLPALVRLLRLEAVLPRRSAGPVVLADGLLGLGLRFPRRVLAIGLGLALLSLAALPSLTFDDDPLTLRDPDSPSVAAFSLLIGDNDLAPYAAQFIAADQAKAAEIEQELTNLPLVSDVIGLADFVPADQEVKLEFVDEMSLFLGALGDGRSAGEDLSDDERRQAFDDLMGALARAGGDLSDPARRLTAALAKLDGAGQGGAKAEDLIRLEQLLLGGLPGRLAELSEALDADTFDLAGLPADFSRRWIAEDGRARLEIQPRDDLRGVAARRAFVDALQARLPGVIGPPVIIVAAGRAVVEAFVQALSYAFAAVFILLLLRLRSLRDSLIVLLPLCLAGLVTAALTVVLSVPFNFANVIVIPLIFGLGVDSAIHLVMRARESAAGLDGSGQATHRAVLLSALTTIASFGALSFSTHPGTASMGLLLTVAVLLSLASTLVLIPALLRAFAKPGTAEAV